MQSAELSGFVADGCERVREGIRAQVEAEYAERLKQATVEEASRLRRQMHEELERRLRIQAKQGSLY